MCFAMLFKTKSFLHISFKLDFVYYGLENLGHHDLAK